MVESALGPEPQICSHIRIQPLMSCETQSMLTSHSVCPLQEGTRAGSATQLSQDSRKWGSTSNRQELRKARRHLSVGSGIRTRGFKSRFSQLLAVKH